MTDSESRTRRSVVTSTGALALAALAGCGGGGGGSSGGSSGSTDGGSGGSGGSGGGSGGSDGSGGDGGGSGGTASFDGWMANVGNYDGVVDETGSDAVTVAVGAEGNGGNFAFAPPAIRVSTGTTVTWEWTGKGAQHNVVAENGAFESDLAGEKGHTFEHTFSESGTYRYACTPHRSLGMKGVVVVA